MGWESADKQVERIRAWKHGRPLIRGDWDAAREIAARRYGEGAAMSDRDAATVETGQRRGAGPRPLTGTERDEMARESLERMRKPPILDVDYCTVGDAVDELAAIREAQRATIERPVTLWHNGAPLAGVPGPDLAALRAATARAEAERDELRARLDQNERARDILRDGVNHLSAELVAMQAERDAARAALALLISDAEIAWHDYHNMSRHAGRREGCELEICRGLRDAVARARAATGRGE